MSSAYQLKVLSHSPDRQRVNVEVSRNGDTAKYLVVAGAKSVVWVRTRGRSYIISADKCNCPASRGRCKHVLVTADLKAQGYFPEEKWKKPTPPVAWAKPAEGGVGLKGTVIRRWSKDARQLFDSEHYGQGWCGEMGVTVAVLRENRNIPSGWSKTTNPVELEFARRCFTEHLANLKRRAVS